MTPSEDLEQIWREFRATKDPGLRNRLVLQYAPLVKYVAGRLRTRMPDSVEQDDLVSDGVLGLMDAIERFEPARGLSFQTFAVPRIRGAIIDGMRSMDFVPRSVRRPMPGTSCRCPSCVSTADGSPTRRRRSPTGGAWSTPASTCSRRRRTTSVRCVSTS